MHRFVPWSKIELKALEETVEEVRESQQQQKDEGEGEGEVEETETIRDAYISFCASNLANPLPMLPVCANEIITYPPRSRKRIDIHKR